MNIFTIIIYYQTVNYVIAYIFGSVKIDMLFSTLTKELMDPGNTMEQTFELVQELKTATEKYFHLKRLFWKVCNILIISYCITIYYIIQYI